MSGEEVKLTDQKLPLWRKIGYGFGELGSQCSWTLISTYLTVFYTDAAGLTPAVISAIMLIARIWDAINDPLFGALAENTKSRWGRFRPYIFWGAPVLALFNCLTFLNLDISGTWKTVWCGFTYIACGMAYTAVNISVGCLANSMTAVNTERVSLNAFRGIMGGIIQMVISAVTMPLILWFGGSTSSGKGYLMAALVFSIVSIPCFWICAAASKEKIGGASENRTETKKESTMKTLLDSFRYTFQDHDAVMLILAMLLFLTGLFGRTGIMTYYFIYVLANPGLLAGFATAVSAGSLGVNFYAPFLLNRFDKKRIGVFSCICQSLCCAVFFFAGEMKMEGVIVIFGFLYGFTNICSLTAFGLGAEIIDDNWIRTGVRADGVIYSCISFSTKLGNAIGGSIGILVLGAVGFAANTEMDPIVYTKMNAVINFGPAFLFLCSAFFFTRIKMTNKMARENEEIIKQKTSSGELSSFL